MEVVQVPASWWVEVAKLTGPFGAIVLLGWLNMRWLDAQVAKDRRRQDELLATYKQDLATVSRMYTDNVKLVEETQAIARQVLRMAEELTSVVSLNTQVQTRLAERIEHNMFCPVSAGRLTPPSRMGAAGGGPSG